MIENCGAQTVCIPNNLFVEGTVDVYYCPTMSRTKEMEALTAAKNLNKLWVVVRQLEKDLGKRQKYVLNLRKKHFCFFLCSLRSSVIVV